MTRSDFANTADIRKLVLFLSDDNQCCGRFCEELFNHRAVEGGLRWEAISRALQPTTAGKWIYPMSPIAIDFLRRRRVRPRNGLRPPLGVTNLDFQVSSVVVALDERAHRPIVEAAWRPYADWLRYWQGGILDVRLPADTFLQLDERIGELIEQLGRGREYFDAA